MLTPDGKTVAGFYTLSQYSVDLAKFPKEMAKKLPKRTGRGGALDLTRNAAAAFRCARVSGEYPEAPATLLGRLAISERFRGQKLGEFLLLDALHRSLRQSRQVASAAVVVDAKDEAAMRFYQHFEFMPIPEIPHRLFLPMTTIEKLLGGA